MHVLTQLAAALGCSVLSPRLDGQVLFRRIVVRSDSPSMRSRKGSSRRGIDAEVFVNFWIIQGVVVKAAGVDVDVRAVDGDVALAQRGVVGRGVHLSSSCTRKIDRVTTPASSSIMIAVFSWRPRQGGVSDVGCRDRRDLRWTLLEGGWSCVRRKQWIVHLEVHVNVIGVHVIREHSHRAIRHGDCSQRVGSVHALEPKVCVIIHVHGGYLGKVAAHRNNNIRRSQDQGLDNSLCVGVSFIVQLLRPCQAKYLAV